MKKSIAKKRHLADIIGRDAIVGASTIGRLFGDRDDDIVRRNIKNQIKKLRTGTVIQRCSGKARVVTPTGEAVARDSRKIRSDFKKAGIKVNLSKMKKNSSAKDSA